MTTPPDTWTAANLLYGRLKDTFSKNWHPILREALDAARAEGAQWACPLCHCCGEVRHDGGDPCVSCAAARAEGAREALNGLAEWLEARAAACVGYGGEPRGPERRMHSDAHDYCHARFEAAEEARARAVQEPPR